MTQPEFGLGNVETNKEAITASTKFSEWMGLLLSEHAAYIERSPEGRESLAMDNEHIRYIESDLPRTSAVITSPASRASLPWLTITEQADANTSWVTSIVQEKPSDKYYTTTTSKLTTTTFGAKDAERVDLPHAVSAAEVNRALNTVAKLRPPRSMEKQPSLKKTGMSRFLGWLGLSSQRDK